MGTKTVLDIGVGDAGDICKGLKASTGCSVFEIPRSVASTPHESLRLPLRIIVHA